VVLAERGDIEAEPVGERRPADRVLHPLVGGMAWMSLSEMIPSCIDWSIM
jgi:hypothetical protein